MPSADSHSKLSPTPPAPPEAAWLGRPSAKVAFYLPNPPLLDPGWQHTDADAVPRLIALNGNHWRKILTIMAKICAPDDDWRAYRDTQLLKQDEQIRIGAEALVDADRHLVCGGVASQALGLHGTLGQALDDAGKLLRIDTQGGQRVLLSPYPDYRQYPNLLLAKSRDWLRAQP
ncbi:DUF6942 family protein [Shewanella salipaludis]|uniref:DUF6942 family protein n=1 Tax=Shewanella salipaludis TaxID=2723052 RepID=UPI001FCECCD0|nr:hypothetical protein [Shewanella salipaludis]